MTILLFGLLVCIFLFFSGFFSGAETGAYCINPVQLRLRSEEGLPSAIRLRRLMEDRPALLSVTLIGTNVANYLTTVSMAILLTHLRAGMADQAIEIYTTLILTPTIFVFGEMVPKNWFRQRADTLMPRCARLMLGFEQICRWIGAVWILKALAGIPMRWLKSGEAFDQVMMPRREIAALLKEGVGGVMSDEQSNLIDRVLGLSSVPIGRIMIPRTRLATLPQHARRDHVLRALRKHPYSRYPVTKRRGREIIGLLDVYDYLANPDNQEIKEHLEQPLQLDPQASVSAALHRMRGARRTFGIVVDRWGNCIGAVTVKDLVEEVVGDLKAW